MALVSIIIATYNSGKTIQKALESVHSQRFIDWECIVIDGLSKDDTLAIVEEYELKDTRFRHISEPDRGIYDAFNKGWKLAKGEWIHYLGSDDRLTEIGFSEIMAKPHDEVDIITGDVWCEKIDGTLKANYSNGFSGCHQGKLVRKSILEKMNGFNENYPILADFDLMLRLEKSGAKVYNVRSFVAFFAMDGMSQKISTIFPRFKERYLILKTNGIKVNPFCLGAKKILGSITAFIYWKIRRLFHIV